MKNQVQDPGVREWFGDDFINMQSEILAAQEALMEGHGDFLISGVLVTDNGNGTHKINSGIAFIHDSVGGNGRFCRVYEQDVADENFPVYLVQSSRDRTAIAAYGRLYGDSSTKNIIVEYYATVENSAPAHENRVWLPTSNNAPRYLDAIQDDAHNFVTGNEKSTWDNKLSALPIKQNEYNRGTEALPVIHTALRVGGHYLVAVTAFDQVNNGMATEVLSAIVMVTRTPDQAGNMPFLVVHYIGRTDTGLTLQMSEPITSSTIGLVLQGFGQDRTISWSIADLNPFVI